MNAPARPPAGGATNTSSPANAASVITARGLALAHFEDASPFDFRLAAGELCEIGGASGSGKTTLARTLLGLIRPAAGELALFGQSLATLAAKRLLDVRRKAAFVQAGDRGGLFPAWSVFDNLALAVRQHASGERLGDDGIAAVLTSEAKRYGIREAWLELPVARCSARQRAAAALWRALRANAELIVIDGGALDPALVGDEIDLERLLADALAFNPAVISMATDRAGALPARWDPARIRRARLRDGRLDPLTE